MVTEGNAYVCSYGKEDGWECREEYAKNLPLKYPPKLNDDNRWFFNEAFLRMENDYDTYEKYARNPDPHNFRKVFKETFEKVVAEDRKAMVAEVDSTLLVI